MKSIKMQKISLSKTDLVTFQQFFTHPPSVKLCIDCFSPEISKNHKVLDPACGSGGFLVRALDDMLIKADNHLM
jgi:type I restriction-modification system DNA methylase subunit